MRAKDQLVHTFERQIVQLTADSSSWRNRYAVLKHAYVITKQRHDALLKTTEVLEQANVTLERDNTALKQDAATQQDYCVATLQKEDALEILRKSHTRLQSERAALQQQLAQKERDLGSANASLQKEYDAVKQNLETRDRELQRLYSALAERNRERTLQREPIQVPTSFYAHCDISQRGPQWEKHASRRLEGESAQMNEGMQGGRSGSDDWQPNSFLETILNTVAQQEYDEPMQGIKTIAEPTHPEEQEPIVESTVLDISEYNPVAREVTPGISAYGETSSHGVIFDIGEPPLIQNDDHPLLFHDEDASGSSKRDEPTSLIPPSIEPSLTSTQTVDIPTPSPSLSHNDTDSEEESDLDGDELVSQSDGSYSDGEGLYVRQHIDRRFEHGEFSMSQSPTISSASLASTLVPLRKLEQFPRPGLGKAHGESHSSGSSKYSASSPGRGKRGEKSNWPASSTSFVSAPAPRNSLSGIKIKLPVQHLS